MGAQPNSDLQPGKVSNSEKCLICYEPHTRVDKEKGISFELKNLKEIFIKAFGIRFLPHFSSYGRIHMCCKCHEEFLKVERIYDDLGGSESNFDAVREQFAFIVVESIIKSQYINNYVHGNAFDAIRYLVFKEWGGKYKKQHQINKAKMEKAKQIHNPIAQSLGLTPVTVKPESNIKIKVHVEKKNPTVSALPVTTEKKAKETNSIKSSDPSPVSAKPVQAQVLDDSVSRDSDVKETSVDASLVNNSSSQSPGNNSSIKETNSATPETESSAGLDTAPAKPVVVHPVEKPSSPSCDATTNDSETATKITTSTSCNATKTSEESIPEIPYVEPSIESAKTAVDQSIKISEQEKSTEPNATIKTAAKPSGSPSTASTSLIQAASNGVTDRTESTRTPKSTPSVSVAQSKPTNPALPQSTYILSPDGCKLISKTGGKLPPKHKLIFVKRDPVTGKMVQVPKPNFSMVKGKLDGREVIVRSAPSSNLQPQPKDPQSIQNSSTTHAKAANLPPQPKVVSAFPVKNVVTEPGSPSVPRIVSVQSISISSNEDNGNAPKCADKIAKDESADSNNQLESEPSSNPSGEAGLKVNKVSPDGKRQSIDDISKSKNGPPEVRSIRSGRRIKRVYDSSSWASGLEMDQLVAQSLKDGRTDRSGYSPAKRQKDSRQSSIANDPSEQFREDEIQD